MTFSGNRDSGNQGQRRGGRFGYSGVNTEKGGYSEEENFGTPEGSLEDEEDYREYVRERELRERELRDRRGGYGQGRPAGGKAGDDRGKGRPGDGRRRDGGGRDQREKAVKAGMPLEGGSAGKGKRTKKRGFFGRILLILFLLVVIAVAAAGGFFYLRMRPVILSVKRVNSVDLESRLLPNIASKVKNDEMMEGYTNIALFGVDSRSGGLLEGDNRSDSIIICSIHDRTGEIRLVSLYRDTLLNVGEDVYTKANAAYARGGPEAAINMLNRNLDMNILDFVTVGFEGLAKTIDALGGIELEIDEEEREYLNMYVRDMHKELGTKKDYVKKSGRVQLNGIQATAYSRIRYTAGDDFRRAQRQRTVLKLTLEKAKAASPVTLADVANQVAGDLAMSLSSKEIVSLILKAGKLELVGTEGIPREEYRGFGSTYEDGEFVLPLTLGDNVCWLHEFLFKEEDYRLSEEAAEINDYISSNFYSY